VIRTIKNNIQNNKNIHKTYKDIFNKRGNSYSYAMNQFPYARHNEFTTLIELLDIKNDDKIVDLPSGGGYLKKHLNTDAEIYSVDPAGMFIQQKVKSKCYLSDITSTPFNDSFFDKAYSLAGTHHLTNKKRFYKEVSRILKPSAIFAYADVAKDTNADRFLNLYVNKYNSLGHDGDFLDINITTNELLNSGFSQVNSRLKNYSWVFSSELHAIIFFRHLFGLNLATDKQIIDGIEKHLHISHNENTFNVQWQLLQFKATN